MKKRYFLFVMITSGLFLQAGTVIAQHGATGIFEGHGDIGDVRHAGSVQFDPATKSYTIAGGGENMWFDQDAFHFVGKPVSGDAALAAEIDWIGTGGNPHRKAVLMLRQSLDPDAPYADAVVHGDGLTSIQYREEKAGRRGRSSPT